MQKVKIDKYDALLWVDTHGNCTISDAGKTQTVVTAQTLEQARSEFVELMQDNEFKMRAEKLKRSLK